MIKATGEHSLTQNFEVLAQNNLYLKPPFLGKVYYLVWKLPCGCFVTAILW